MEEKFKQFLKKQMEKEAEQIEKEVLSNESLKEVQAPDTLREALAKSIKEYEKNRTDAPSEESEEIGISIEEFCEKLSKEDRESYFRWRAAEEKKKAKKARKRFHFPRKKRAVFVVAATMILVLGIGMTSLGGRPYWLKVADLVLGNENTVKVNTEGEDRLETTKVDEKEAYEQIKEELGIEPVQLQYMLAYMEKNLCLHLTIEQICRDNMIGRSQLQKIFQQKTGLGVIEYFSNMKIDAAKQMMRTDLMNFTQIAEKLGYSSIHYFSRQFKKITGMTPSEYVSSIKALSEV